MGICNYCLEKNIELRFGSLYLAKSFMCGFYAAEISVHFEKQSVGSEKSFHGLCTFSVHFILLIDRFHKDGGD